MGVFVGIALVGLLIAVIGAKLFVKADPKVLARVIKVVAGIALAAVAAILVLRGRIDIGMLAALGAGALFGIGRFGALFGGGMFGRGLGTGWSRARTGQPQPDPAASGGQGSGIETAWLRLQLDHGSGALSGEVLQGEFRGRTLAGLNETDLLRLYAEVSPADPQSARLLETYLDRRLGPEWRSATAGDPGAAPATPMTGNMTRGQALEILGLDEMAQPAEIREAHRRLMKKMHPDHGGSNFLAAQINRAKEVLLGE